MLKTVVVVLVVLALALVAGSAMAGDYHTGATLICSDCHTMHFSESHDYTGGAAPSWNGSADGPNAKLLKASPNALCLQCHDGQTFAPDVYGANTNGYVREAGALPTGVSPYENWKGHELGSTQTPPGSTGNWTPGADGLECISCHLQHGGSNYRNIFPHIGSESITVSYATVTNDLTKDVYERDPSLGQLATHYSVGNVDFNQPDTTNSAIGTFCGACHGNFHGNATSANMNNGTDWLRHPDANAIIGSGAANHGSTAAAWGYAGKTNYVHVMDPNGLWSYETGADVGIDNATLVAKGYTPMCLTCHKAHGNQNPFGLIEMGDTGTVTEEGTAGSTAKTLCNQCHNQGM